MALPTTRLMTVDEFEALLALPENRERRLELIDGEIVEKTMPTEEHSIITNLFLYYFTQYALEHKIGLPGPERRFQIPGDTQNSRIPDASLTIETKTPMVKRGAVPFIPDIIVEVKSPDDTEEAQRAKFYIAHGARLVILAFPDLPGLEVYRPGVPVEGLGIGDSLSGYDVLPGFEVAVNKLFITHRGGN